MAVVAMKIGGREYQIACDNGQEEHLRGLADEVDDRVSDVRFRMGGAVNETMSFLLVAVMMADELVESKKEIDRLSAEVQHLTAWIANQPQGGASGGDESGRIAEMEDTMAITLEEIAQRIETIAQRIEIR